MQCSCPCSLGVPALPPSPFFHQFWGSYHLFKPEKTCGRPEEGMASGRTNGEHLREHPHNPVSCPACSLLKAALSALELVTKHANHV